MYSYNEVELLARDYQHRYLQEAGAYRLTREAARKQRSLAGLKHLALGLITFLMKL